MCTLNQNLKFVKFQKVGWWLSVRPSFWSSQTRPLTSSTKLACVRHKIVKLTSNCFIKCFICLRNITTSNKITMILFFFNPDQGTGIPAFYVSFVLAPLASNASEYAFSNVAIIWNFQFLTMTKSKIQCTNQKPNLSRKKSSWTFFEMPTSTANHANNCTAAQRLRPPFCCRIHFIWEVLGQIVSQNLGLISGQVP